MIGSVRELVVPVRTPYRLDLTAAVLRRLSINVVDTFDGTTYARLLGDPKAPTAFSVRQVAPDALAVRLEGPAAQALEPAQLVARMLGSEVRLDAFEQGATRFPWLARLVSGARGVRPPRYPSLWEATVNAIVFQQVSIHAAGAILRRVVERYQPAVELSHAGLRSFPEPQTLRSADPQELRRLGLSVNKVTALAGVAAAIERGELDEAELARLPTPELTERLARARGIGPWTAAVIALRGFGRLDVFPMNDSGVAKSLRAIVGAEPIDVDAVLESLGTQRGMLYYHLLLARLADRGEVELA